MGDGIRKVWDVRFFQAIPHNRYLKQLNMMRQAQPDSPTLFHANKCPWRSVVDNGSIRVKPEKLGNAPCIRFWPECSTIHMIVPASIFFPRLRSFLSRKTDYLNMGCCRYQAPHLSMWKLVAIPCLVLFLKSAVHTQSGKISSVLFPTDYAAYTLNGRTS